MTKTNSANITSDWGNIILRPSALIEEIKPTKEVFIQQCLALSCTQQLCTKIKAKWERKHVKDKHCWIKTPLKPHESTDPEHQIEETISRFTSMKIEVSVLVVSGHLPPLYDKSSFDITKKEAEKSFEIMNVSNWEFLFPIPYQDNVRMPRPILFCAKPIWPPWPLAPLLLRGLLRLLLHLQGAQLRSVGDRQGVVSQLCTFCNNGEIQRSTQWTNSFIEFQAAWEHNLHFLAFKVNVNQPTFKV